MPHFVIECSAQVLTLQPAETILREVHDVAEATGLFRQGDIKVRIHPYRQYLVGHAKDDFIHVFGNVMQGRTIEQKADLSRRIVEGLTRLLPEVPVVSMNVVEFERATYCNRTA